MTTATMQTAKLGAMVEGAARKSREDDAQKRRGFVVRLVEGGFDDLSPDDQRALVELIKDARRHGRPDSAVTEAIHRDYNLMRQFESMTREAAELRRQAEQHPPERELLDQLAQMDDALAVEIDRLLQPKRDLLQKIDDARGARRAAQLAIERLRSVEAAASELLTGL